MPEAPQPHQSIWNVLSDLVLLVDPGSLHIRYANESAQDALGHRLEELSRLTLLDFCLPLDHTRLRALTAQLDVDQIAHFVGFLYSHHGTTVATEVWIMLTGMYGERMLLCVAHEIREQVTIAQQMGRLSHVNNSIIREAPIGIITIDRTGRVTQVNPAQVQINQMPENKPEDFLGMPLLDNQVVQQNGLDEPLRQVLEGQNFNKIFESFVLQNDAVISLQIQGVPLRDLSGEVEGGLLLVQDITEQLKADRERQENEALYRSLVNAMPDLLFRIHRDGTFRDLSNSTDVELYRPREEVIGRTISEVVPPDVAEKAMAALHKTLETGRVQTYEYQLTFSDGSIHDFEARACRAIADEALFIVRDISDQKKAENNLRRERELADTLRDIGTIVTSTLDLDEVLASLLKEVQRVVPYDGASVMAIENGVARIISHRGYERLGRTPEDMDNVFLNVAEVPLIQQVIETHEPFVAADTHRDHNWVQLKLFSHIRSCLGAPIVSRNGEILGIFSFDSLTPGFYNEEYVQLLKPFTRQAAVAFENAQHYQQIQAQAVQLTTRLNQLDTLYSAGQYVLSTLERKEVLMRLAEQMSTITHSTSAMIFDFNPDTVEGEVQVAFCTPYAPCHDGLLAPGDHLSLRSPFLKPVIAHDHNSLLLYNADFDRAFPDVALRLHAGIIVPMLYRDRMTGFALIGEGRAAHILTQDDIRICEALAAQAAIALEQAAQFSAVQELEQLKSQMIRVASHDLRNPLARAQTALEILRERVKALLPPDQSKYLDRIEYSLDEMGQIVEDILSLERIEARHRTAEPIIWCQLLERATVHLSADAETKGLKLEISCEPGLPSIGGDPVQLSQAVSNLVSNAIKYTPAGGHISVQAYAKDYGGQPTVAIEVQDSGLGIPAELQAMLFQPFYRAKQSGTESISGIGLGLTIVKAAIERHGGTVYFDSEPGEGSLFGFRIPV